MNLMEIAALGLEHCEDIFGKPGGPTPIGISVEGKPTNLALVLGDNAAGKSFFRKLTTQAAKAFEPTVQSIHLSMDGRCQSGIPRLMMYGSESEESTGYNSVNTIEGAISTSRQRESAHIIFFDEPDVGLSDRWARAAAARLAGFLRDPPAHLVGMFVATHRRVFVEQLLPLDPSILCVGHQWPTSLADWLAGDPRPLEPLTALRDEGIKKYRDICDILDSRKKEK